MMTYTQVQYGILLMTITSNLVINAELHFRKYMYLVEPIHT